jgi:hypothetical protein
MPYTEPQDRVKVDELIAGAVSHTGDWSAGDLTYGLTKLVVAWIKSHGKKYLNLAIVMGCLFCTAFELYRRVIAPYEDKKRQDNGDVYGDIL